MLISFRNVGTHEIRSKITEPSLHLPLEKKKHEHVLAQKDCNVVGTQSMTPLDQVCSAEMINYLMNPIFEIILTCWSDS